MNILIASDIHGSAFFCRRLLELYKSSGASKLLLLGDILYHGPRNDLPAEYSPKQVAEMLNEISNDILCVRGNCEAEVDQMMLKFPVMAEYALIDVCGHTAFVTHGHNFNKEKLPPLKPGDVLLHGHTHVPVCEPLPCGAVYINPGSVSIPKENSANSCILLRDGEFKWMTVEGKTYKSYTVGG